MRGALPAAGAARVDDASAWSADGDNPRMSEANATSGSANVRVWQTASAAVAADEGTEPPPGIGLDSAVARPQAWAHVQRHSGVVRGGRTALDESFRLLRHRLRQDMQSQGLNLLAVTSARAVAGRSLLSLNLALTLAADLDTTALLVDAELAGHGVQTLFGLPGLPGLAEHLSHGLPLTGLWVDPGVERLRFLPAGAEPAHNPAELLASRAAQALALALREQPADRMVVVDLPPLLHAADALAFLPHAQATLLVVEEHTTPRADLDLCAELLAPYRLIGTVLCPPPPPGAGSRRWW